MFFMGPINKKLATMTEMYTLPIERWLDLNDSAEFFDWMERYEYNKSEKKNNT